MKQLSINLRLILCLAAVPTWIGCGAGTASEEEVAAQPNLTGPVAETTQSLNNDGAIAVLLIGNSQLGYPPDPPAVGPALRDFSATVNGGVAKISVTVMQDPEESCDLWVKNQPAMLAEAGTGKYDLVIFQPPFTEINGNAACWDLYKNAAETHGSEFGVLATQTLRVADALNIYYGTQGDVKLDNAVRSYCADRQILYIPANRTMRQMLGNNPSPAALAEWYNTNPNDRQHPSARGAYVYVLALYQAITWRTVNNTSADLKRLYCHCDPNAPCVDDGTNCSAGLNINPTQASLIQGSVTGIVGNRIVALKANSNGKFVTAESMGNSPLVNRAMTIDTWEQYRLNINNDATVALKATINNSFVCAEAQGSQPLIANRQQIGQWESFVPIRVGGRFFALRSKADNKFVTFHQDGVTPAIARQDVILDWEKFSVSYL